jgi:hypothetical protein
LCQDERFTITAIVDDGQPIEPKRTKDAFSAQCGAIVRDSIPISIQLWNKPKNEDPQVSYVTDRQKDDLWTSLKENFTLPPEEDPNKPVIEPLVKACALKKMAPDRAEVDEVFEVPLGFVLDPANFRVQGRMWQGGWRHYLVIPYGPHYVWGATARMLKTLADRMRDP